MVERDDTSAEEASPPPVRGKARAKAKSTAQVARGTKRPANSELPGRGCAGTAQRPTGDPHAAGASSNQREDTSSDEPTPAKPTRSNARTLVKRRPAKACAVAAAGEMVTNDFGVRASPDSADQIEGHASKGPLRPVPKTSGITDYMRWVVADALTEEESSTLAAKLPKMNLVLGSMCAGMGTESMVLSVFHSIMCEREVPFKYRFAFKAEKDPEKMKFLMRHAVDGRTTFVCDNGELQKEAMTDVKGDVVNGQLPVDILMCGIVCKDISPLNTKPKTERAKEGQSGSSLHGMLGYLESQSIEQRPKVIILECVQRLGHKRQVDPDDRQGTLYIQDELAGLGFVGEWVNVSAKEFFLPQSRPRVYGLFLKLTDLSGVGREQRKRDVAAAVRLIQRLRVPGEPEPLERVLQRCQALQYDGSRDRPKKARRAAHGPCSWDLPPEELADGPAWRREHHHFVQTLSLSSADLDGFSNFAGAVGDALLPRPLESLWLKLVVMRKEHGSDWSKGVIVASHGASLRFMSVRRDVFPCVTPHMSYTVLTDGEVTVPGGFEALALQGLQTKEVQKFKLRDEKSSFLQDLAGNAYTANIVGAFLVAGIMAM
jgi:site-specific DNA-cytosine methylase